MDYLRDTDVIEQRTQISNDYCVLDYIVVSREQKNDSQRTSSVWTNSDEKVKCSNVIYRLVFWRARL